MSEPSQSQMGQQPVGMSPSPYATQSAPLSHIGPTSYLSRNSQRTLCPYCKADVVTAVHYESGCCTADAAIALLQACLCWLLFCTDCTKDVVHTCPACGQTIGVAKFG